MQINTVGKIAIGAGLVAGAGLLLAACGDSEKDPQAKVLDDFQPFDRSPRDNNWSQNEVTRFEVGRPYTTNRHNMYRIGDHVMQQWQIVHKESNYSMEKAYAAARGEDGLASLAELVSLATSFDRDKNGTLNRSERRAFEDAYGVDVRSRTVIDRTETGLVYDPIDRYPSGGGGGHTSPGDDYGNGGGGSTSPGDDGGGYTPPSGGGGGGTAPGDDGGSTRPDPPSRPSSGNSTDNGNPSESDF